MHAYCNDPVFERCGIPVYGADGKFDSAANEEWGICAGMPTGPQQSAKPWAGDKPNRVKNAEARDVMGQKAILHDVEAKKTVILDALKKAEITPKECPYWVLNEGF